MAAFASCMFTCVRDCRTPLCTRLLSKERGSETITSLKSRSVNGEGPGLRTPFSRSALPAPRLTISNDLPDGQSVKSDDEAVVKNGTRNENLKPFNATRIAILLTATQLVVCACIAYVLGVAIFPTITVASKAMSSILAHIRLEATRRQFLLRSGFVPRATQAVIGAFRISLWALLFLITAIATSKGRKVDPMVGRNAST